MNTATAGPQTPNWWTYIGEGMKVAVVIAFLLYAIGFVIWNSYLGQYGVTPSGGLLQVEFVSAALCYVVLVVAFGIPMGVIAHQYLPRAVKMPKGPFPWTLLVVWYFVIQRLQILYFPDTRWAWHWSDTVIPIVACMHLVLWVVLRKKWRETGFVKFLSNSNWIYVYSFIWTFIGFLMNAPSPWFLLSLSLLYVMITAGIGGYVLDYWPKETISYKLMFALAAGLLLVGNIRAFGQVEFPFIPRSIGGGKAERAFIKFANGHEDLSRWISNVSTNAETNNAFGLLRTNRFSGPVWILYRSDKDVIFRNSTNKLAGAKQVRSELIEAVEFVR